MDSIEGFDSNNFGECRIKECDFVTGGNCFLTGEDDFLAGEDGFLTGGEGFRSDEGTFDTDEDGFPSEGDGFGTGEDGFRTVEGSLEFQLVNRQPKSLLTFGLADLVFPSEEPDAIADLLEIMNIKDLHIKNVRSSFHKQCNISQVIVNLNLDLC